jgi:hypothetical protein
MNEGFEAKLDEISREHGSAAAQGLPGIVVPEFERRSPASASSGDGPSDNSAQAAPVPK